jgi:hypothetical protein
MMCRRYLRVLKYLVLVINVWIEFGVEYNTVFEIAGDYVRIIFGIFFHVVKIVVGWVHVGSMIILDEVFLMGYFDLMWGTWTVEILSDLLI